MLAQFIRAQLTLAGLSLLAYTSVLGIMRVPYAMVLGTAGGVLEFVPIVGPLVAGTAMSWCGASRYSYWPLLLLFLVVWRLAQDYIIAPRVMGGSVQTTSLSGPFRSCWLVARSLVFSASTFRFRLWRVCRIVWRRWRILRGKAQVWTTQRVFPPARPRPRKKLTPDSLPFPRPSNFEAA